MSSHSSPPTSRFGDSQTVPRRGVPEAEAQALECGRGNVASSLMDIFPELWRVGQGTSPGDEIFNVPTDCKSEQYKKYETRNEEVWERVRYIRFLTAGKGKLPGRFQELYGSLGYFSPVFTLLKGLSISVQSYDDLDRLLGAFGTPNSLRQLSLDLGFGFVEPHGLLYGRFGIVLGRLSHVKLRGSLMWLDDCVTLLKYCKEAVEIDFTIEVPPLIEKWHETEAFYFTLQSQTQLAKVRWLKVAISRNTEAIFQHIECPNLENLFISVKNSVDLASVSKAVTGSEFFPQQERRGSLKQLVIAVHCPWDEICNAEHLKHIGRVQEVELRVVSTPKTRQYLYCSESVKARVEAHCGVQFCLCTHDSHLFHLGKTARKGVHIGTPMVPSVETGQWELGFWHQVN
ncbi:hypothetical protein NMY22_g13574 [Coprinellus aureogranulatus]|nr:hypothetical protein NMY22_g13574 [Coprinellus aureogranulatus]